MKNEDRIVELLAEMVEGQDRLTDEVYKMQGEIFKLNLNTSENSKAILKLADEIRLVAEH